MSAASPVRLPDGSGEIPLLNHGFEISPEAARDLWMEGKMMPEHKGHVPPKDRVLRSADGEWVIHRLPRQEPEEVAAEAIVELEQLQQYGVDVISHSLTLSPGRKAVFAVTPFIPGLEVCTKELYYARLARKIGRYLDDPDRAGRRLADINKFTQYATLPPVIEEPFLHDVDPYLSASRG